MVDTKKTDIDATAPSGVADSDFVLKHRVVGAAFLLFFGALVLPWLLGPPSQASKASTVLTVEANDGEISALEIENEILADLEDNSEIAIEQVYISKITPLDAARVEEERRRAEADKASKSSAVTMARADVGESNTDTDKTDLSSDTSVSRDTKPTKQAPPKSVPKKSVEVAKTEPVDATPKSNSSQTPKVTAEKKATDKNTEVAETKAQADSREERLAAALAAESNEQSVTVGWAVQVGVWNKKAGAQRILKDLKAKGFAPSATEVKTNQGPATRVWLGPFAQRVEAARTKARLKDRTGVAGFLREYP